MTAADTSRAPGPATAGSNRADRIAELESRVDHLRVSRDGWNGVVLFVALFAVLASVAAVGFGVRATDLAKGGGEASASGKTVTQAVALGDLFVRPAKVSVGAGDRLVLEVTNDGQMQHDLKLRGEAGTAMLAPGESETVDLGVITAAAEAWCTVPGHRAAGMVLAIEVTGAATARPRPRPAVRRAPAGRRSTLRPSRRQTSWPSIRPSRRHPAAPSTP